MTTRNPSSARAWLRANPGRVVVDVFGCAYRFDATRRRFEAHPFRDGEWLYSLGPNAPCVPEIGQW